MSRDALEQFPGEMGVTGVQAHTRLLGLRWLLDQANHKIAWRTRSLGRCGEVGGGKWGTTEGFFPHVFLILQVVVKGEKRQG